MAGASVPGLWREGAIRRRGSSAGTAGPVLAKNSAAMRRQGDHKATVLAELADGRGPTPPALSAFKPLLVV